MRLPIVAVSALFAAVPAVAFAPGASISSAPFRSSSSCTTALSAFVDVNENAQRNLGPFDQWATNAGVQKIDGFQLTSEDGKDWSVVTTTDLQAGQPIMRVPAGVVLTSSKAKAELEEMSASRGGGVQAAADELGRMGGGLSIPQFYLFVKILVEFERGDASPYFPYLDSLPRLFYNAVSMTDFCYECLPPLVFRLSRAERSKFDNFYQVLQKVDVVSPELKKERELCKWAFNVVHTRCTPKTGSGEAEQGGEQRIAPMADMFNHGSTDTEIELTYDAEGNCNAVATRDVPAGSPLRMSYGCPTNPSHFFATYGFLDETAPATFCKIMDIQPTPELVDIGFDFSKMLFYKDTGDISQEVWDVVLYSKVLNRDLNLQRQFYEAHVRGDANTKQAIHQQYMLETATELKNHVDNFLKQLDDLGAKSVGKDFNEHPRLPLILRHNEFVRQTFENVKARLDPMVAQAQQQSMVMA